MAQRRRGEVLEARPLARDPPVRTGAELPGDSRRRGAGGPSRPGRGRFGAPVVDALALLDRGDRRRLAQGRSRSHHRRREHLEQGRAPGAPRSAGARDPGRPDLARRHVRRHAPEPRPGQDVGRAPVAALVVGRLCAPGVRRGRARGGDWAVRLALDDRGRRADVGARSRPKRASTRPSTGA